LRTWTDTNAPKRLAILRTGHRLAGPHDRREGAIGTALKMRNRMAGYGLKSESELTRGRGPRTRSVEVLRHVSIAFLPRFEQAIE
jgi:hypothetical protein